MLLMIKKAPNETSGPKPRPKGEKKCWAPEQVGKLSYGEAWKGPRLKKKQNHIPGREGKGKKSLSRGELSPEKSKTPEHKPEERLGQSISSEEEEKKQYQKHV